MRRLNVVIADDEERVCRLIQALVDWEEMGLFVAGTAHNGVEACQIVQEIKPDILITDIRMPGCSGLELIQQVKKSQPQLEVIIISGYAHFEYAQQAIRYGVGYYLLKPISKVELRETLQKLKERIFTRLESEQDKQELLRKARQEDQQLRQSLVMDMLEHRVTELSCEQLKEQYGISVGDGIFQGICLKMDCSLEELSSSSEEILVSKMQEILERTIGKRCQESLLAVRDCYVYGILHYEPRQQEEIRRLLKDCLNQLEVRKNLFKPVEYSLSVGPAVNHPEEMGQSLEQAGKLIHERFLKGTGRLLERFAGTASLGENGFLDSYLREVSSAAEVMGLSQADRAAELLQQELCSVKEIRGYEILDMVFAAAEVFTARLQIADRSSCLSEFREKCGQCSSADQLFACLRDFQRKYLQEMIDRHENETVRPVRKAKQYIQNHFSEQITLEEVSEAVGLSAAYFSVLFKKTEGEGFAKYLINVRMEQARVLLRESNYPVTEICRRVGYNDLKHFTRTFEKAAGVKPSTYRKLYG